MALVCETVTAATTAELREARDRSRADLVELRLDGVRDPDPAGALADRRRPVIITCRAARDGGRFDGSEPERLRLLADAIRGGADYVDVEWETNRSALPVGPGRIVLSHHDFSSLPADLPERATSMRRAAPDGVLKIAVVTQSAGDLVKLRAATAGIGGSKVIVGMGPAGTLSRVCPDRFGSAWTYGGDAAPGQLLVSELLDRYRVGSQSAASNLFAVTGSPLAHSASPAMHNAAFAACGIDAVYVALEARSPREFLEAAEAFGVNGASVTAPLKTGWKEVGVDLDSQAVAVGAANTLKRARGGWAGANFDVDGFLAPLAAVSFDPAGVRAVVVGAGGAARAAAWCLLRQGARVEIAARRRDRAEALAAGLGAGVAAWPPEPGWDLLVNATPAGTWPDVEACAVPRESVKGRVVYDLVYHPRETTLLRWAREAGAQVVGGLEMLVHQAGRQFEYWCGQAAPIDVMRAAALEFLDARSDNEATTPV